MKKQSAKTRNLYGQEEESTETPELVAEKLKELEDELKLLSDDEKKGWIQALNRCPELIKDDHKLLFLRCEVFRANLAAARLVAYWDMRIEVFGPERAFMPLTAKGVVQHDHEALTAGYVRIVPAKDPEGRGIVFADPSRQDTSRYSTESMVRVSWYLVHAILEDESVQRKGVLYIGYTRNAKMGQFDPELFRRMSECFKGCLPVRISGVHVCHPTLLFHLVFPLVKFFVGERIRNRIKLHGGSDEKVLRKLGKYGLTKDRLPTDLGGLVSLDNDRWIKDRSDSGL